MNELISKKIGEGIEVRTYKVNTHQWCQVVEEIGRFTTKESYSRKKDIPPYPMLKEVIK